MFVFNHWEKTQKQCLGCESTELYGLVGIRAEACRTLGLLPLFKEGGCPRPHEQTVNPGIQESVNMSLSGERDRKVVSCPRQTMYQSKSLRAT